MELDYDFSFYLTVATLATGFIYLLDKLFLEAKRNPVLESNNEEETVELAKEPAVIEFSKSFFPVLLLVLVIRSFIAEPFRIPSGSMIPTLLVGDFLVVSKYSYGIRLPVINKKIIDIGEPERGDVVVFRYPEDPTIDFIKRIVGLPGDVVQYIDNNLYINGNNIEQGLLRESAYIDINGRAHKAVVMQENLLGFMHEMQEHKGSRGIGNTSVKVPEGHYFALGDNRDHSKDSRFWGFIPDKNLVGKAQFIWMHLGFENLKRIGTTIK
jgi:signal peptidase I